MLSLLTKASRLSVSGASFPLPSCLVRIFLMTSLHKYRTHFSGRLCDGRCWLHGLCPLCHWCRCRCPVRVWGSASNSECPRGPGPRHPPRPRSCPAFGVRNPLFCCVALTAKFPIGIRVSSSLPRPWLQCFILEKRDTPFCG